MIPPSPTLLQALRRFWMIAVAGLVLGGLAAVAAAVLLPPKSVAVAKVGLDDPRGSNVFRNANLAPTDLIAYAQGQANFASSQPVIEAAAATLPERPSVEELQASIAVTVNTKSPTLEIAATSDDASTSVARANAVATAYRQLAAKNTAASAATALQTISDSRAAILDALPARASADSPEGKSASTSLSALDERAGEIRLAASLFNDGVSYTVGAHLSGVTSTGNVPRNVIGGLLLGLLAGAAVALAMASRRRPAEDADELCDALRTPLIGVLKPRRGLLPEEQVELVTAGLGLAPATVLTFVGVPGARGVGDLVADVARTYASWGHTVGVALPEGEVLNGTAIVGGSRTSYADGSGRVDVLGIPDLRAAGPYIDELVHRCQVVLAVAPRIDTAGAVNLLMAAGQSVLVVSKGTGWTPVHRAGQVLERTGAPLGGVLFLGGPVRSTRLAVRKGSAAGADVGPGAWQSPETLGRRPSRASSQ